MKPTPENPLVHEWIEHEVESALAGKEHSCGGSLLGMLESNLKRMITSRSPDAAKDCMNGLLLAQNKEQFHGYTIFHFNFSGKTIRFMSFEDVKRIVELARPDAGLVAAMKRIADGDVGQGGYDPVYSKFAKEALIRFKL